MYVSGYACQTRSQKVKVSYGNYNAYEFNLSNFENISTVFLETIVEFWSLCPKYRISLKYLVMRSTYQSFISYFRPRDYSYEMVIFLVSWGDIIVCHDGIIKQRQNNWDRLIVGSPRIIMSPLNLKLLTPSSIDDYITFSLTI